MNEKFLMLGIVFIAAFVSASIFYVVNFAEDAEAQTHPSWRCSHNCDAQGPQPRIELLEDAPTKTITESPVANEPFHIWAGSARKLNIYLNNKLVHSCGSASGSWKISCNCVGTNSCYRVCNYYWTVPRARGCTYTTTLSEGTYSVYATGTNGELRTRTIGFRGGGSASRQSEIWGRGPTTTFTVAPPCNENNICDGAETASACPNECLSSSQFDMSIDPTQGIANKGDVKDVNVSLTITGSGYAQLSAESVPSGTTAAFSPASCGTADCYSNATFTTSVSSTEGWDEITIKATSGSEEKNAIYNLTILTDNVTATCGSPTTCDYPETQSSCSSDCQTTASIPSPVSPGDIVTVTVEFYDSRYVADGKVKIDMVINPEGTSWTPANGCFFGGQKMGSVASGNIIAWPPGTVSEDGHFRISTTCTLPSSISAGSHTLVATPTIF